MWKGKCSAAASAQTSRGCHYILYLQEDKRTDTSCEKAQRTTNGSQEQEALMCKNWPEVQKGGFNLCILYK